MKSFEKDFISAINTDSSDEGIGIPLSEEFYCVKVGYVPGGCKQPICNDLTDCPYVKDKNFDSF